MLHAQHHGECVDIDGVIEMSSGTALMHVPAFAKQGSMWLLFDSCCIP